MIQNASPTPDGELWLMELDFLSGSTANSPFFDMSGDLQLTSADRVSYVSGDTLPSGAHVGDINTTATGVPVGKFIDNGVGSQPLLVQLATLNTTLLNQNPDVTLPALAGDPGVAGGHFDFDIYYSKIGASQHHVHQYDDVYDVTGVNMLNASDSAFNLAKAIPGNGTQFKILVQNQYLNPAATLSVGGQPYTSVKLYNDQAKETSAANVIANAPTYTRATAGFTLAFNLPLDAFAARTGGMLSSDRLCRGRRAGGPDPHADRLREQELGSSDSMYQSVIPPASTVNGPGTNSTTSGVRHNGALVIQLIKANTPASEIEMAVPGHPEYGWRVDGVEIQLRRAGGVHDVLAPPQQAVFRRRRLDQDPAAGHLQHQAEEHARGRGRLTDPKVGSFKATSSMVSVTTTVNGT